MSNINLDIFCDSVTKYIASEIGPHFDELDLWPLIRTKIDLHQKLKETGIFEVWEADEDFSTLDAISRVLFEMGKVNGGIASYVAYHLAGEFIRRKFAPQIPAQTVCLALMENDEVEFDLPEIAFTTKLDQGKFTGIKKSVMLAPVSDVYAVFTEDRGQNVIAWISRKNGQDRCFEHNGLMGIRAVPCADLSFENIEADFVTPVSKSDIHFTLALLSVLLGACSAGISTRSLENGLAYARLRYQGGKQIDQHDAIKLMYMKNLSMLQSATTVLMLSAQQLNGENDLSIREVFKAKVCLNEATVNATLDAIQIHGGYGYMRDYDVEKRFRDAMTLSLLPQDSTRASLLCMDLG